VSVATTDPESQSFLRSETAGAAVLLVATVAALVWANWPGGSSYDDVWDGTAHRVVNDWVLAVFFLLIGLEIKRELVHGSLRDRRAAVLPVVAAVGGMVAPALVFIAVAGSTMGWAIPMATDVAFVAGALTLLGPRAPDGLRAFLLTLAVVDDIGAIVVLAVVYSAGLFHPTLIAVLIGLAAPAGGRTVERIEHGLHPFSALVAVPLFALANAGVRLEGASPGRLMLAVAMGFAVGKPAGIWCATRLAQGATGGRPPGGLLGGGALAGIGFTVALFVAERALDAGDLAEAKLGILAGSAASAALGAGILGWHDRRRRAA